MGTRHLTAVVLNGAFRVAQYGQWDGYLSGQGKTILDFISQMDVEKFKENVSKCRFISDEENTKLWEAAGAPKDSQYVTMEVSENMKKLYPALSRDTGADVLNLIYEGKADMLQDSISFAGESLFCEFAYVLDLDKGKLEIYLGFNKGKARGRFSKMKVDKEYNPVTLWKTLTFDKCKEAGLLKKLEKAYAEREKK